MAISVNGYPFDLVESVQHELEAEVTTHPVETGTAVADNVILKPRELTLTNGVVSDTPIGAIAQDDSRRGQLRFSQDAYNRLETIWLAKATVVVVTRLKKYESMILDKLSVPQESKNAGGLVFTAHFLQITVVKNNRVTVAAANLLGRQDLGNRGSQIKRPLGVTYVASFSPNARVSRVPQYGQPILTTTAAQRAPTNGNVDDGLGTLDHYAVPEGQPIDGYVKDETARLQALIAKDLPPGKKLPGGITGQHKYFHRLAANSHIPGYPSTGVDNTKKNRTGARSGKEASDIYNHAAGNG